MSLRLICRPLPLATEGLNGYLLRLAEGNGLSRITHLWPSGAWSFEVLCQRLGFDSACPDAHLEYLRPQFAIEKVLHPVWNRHHSRFCPACLGENPTWRREWELTLMTVCPRHQLRLVDVCGVCGEKQDWRRSRLLYCNCGASLKSGHRSPAEAEEAGLASLLVQKLFNESMDLEYLDVLSLAQLNKLIFVLGAYAENRGKKFSQKIAKVTDQVKARALVSASARILMRWPASYFQFLAGLKSEKDAASNRMSLVDRFGYFYQYLYRQLREPEYAFLHQGFESFIEKNWKGSLAERNKRLSVDLRRRHTWVPIRIVIRELGISQRELQRLMEDGRIEVNTISTSKGRQIACVNRRDIVSLQSMLHDIVDLRTACRMLSIKKERMAQLLDHDIIGSIFQAKVSRTARWGIPKKNLQAILDLAGGLPYNSPDNPELVSFGYFLQYRLNDRVLFPNLLLAIIKGEITPVAVSEAAAGIAGWLFERTSMEYWVRDRRRGNLNGALSIPEAARHLNIKQQALYHLTCIGVMKTAFRPETNHLLIEQSELERFSEKYVYGNEIRERTGLLSTHAARRLRSMNIFPVSGNEIDNGFINLYQRGPVLDAALEEVKNANRRKILP